MLYMEVTFQIFKDRFRNYGFASEFSLIGLEALWDYYEVRSEDNDLLFDVVEINCMWHEYTSDEELLNDYPADDEFDDVDEAVESVVERIRDESCIISLINGNYLVKTY